MKNYLIVITTTILINFFNLNGAISDKPLSIPSPSELTLVEELGGSTEALKAQDSQGNFWVLKTGDSAQHCYNEYQANRAYKALGVPVPEGEIFTSPKKSKASLVNAWISGSPLGQYFEIASQDQISAVISQLRKHFVADCLLGNWDSIGLELDNIIVDKEGTPWRIDNGGALEFRAQGEKKGKDWGPQVKELSSLLDPRINSVTAEIFKDISNEEILQQIEEIEQNQEALFASVDERIKPMLKERFYYLIQYKYKLVKKS